MKKNIIKLLIFIMIFMFIDNVKAVTYSGPEKDLDNCQKDTNGNFVPFYYSVAACENDNETEYSCDYLRTNKHACSSENDGTFTDACNTACTNKKTCVKVEKTCRYTIKDDVTQIRTQAFCLEGHVGLDEGDDVLYNAEIVEESDVSDMMCGLVKSYGSGIIKRSYFTDNKLDLSKIPNSEIWKIQHDLWSYQGHKGSCDPITEGLSSDEISSISLATTNNQITFTFDPSNKQYVSTPITVTLINAKFAKLYLVGTTIPEARITSNSNYTGGVAFAGDGPISVSGTGDRYIIIPAQALTESNISNLSSLKLEAQTNTRKKTSFKVSYTKLTFANPTSDNLFSQALGIPALNMEETIETGETITQIEAKLETGSITILKTNSKDNSVVEGAKFKLYYNNLTTPALYYNGVEVGQLVTNSEGKIVINNLPLGKYIIQEVESASGYVMNSTINIERSLTYDSPTATVSVPNNPKNIVFSKKTILDEEELKGATIAIYKYNNTTKEVGELENEFTSTESPYEYYLSPGYYMMRETAAPEGYTKLESEFIFYVNNKFEVTLISSESTSIFVDGNSVTLYNEVVPVPDTGFTGINLFLILSSVFISLGSMFVAYIALKKRQCELI